MTEEWKYIKDFIIISGGTETVPRLFEDFLIEKRLPTTIVDILRDELKETGACILSTETEEGLKSCLTFGLEAAEEHIGKMEKTDRGIKISIAEEFYEFLKNESKKAVKETWGKFNL